MKLTRSLLRPIRYTSFFRRRRCTSNASFRGGSCKSTTFFRKRGSGAGENPEPSSPKVTCIGQVRVQSKKRVKQYRRRIGEASFRSGEQQPPPPPRDQRFLLFPSVSVFLRAFGKEFCCLFRWRWCCFSRREKEREKRENVRYEGENAYGAMVERWLVEVNGGEGERRGEIEVVVGSGDEEEMEIISGEHSRRHVFDDIEVNGDRVEVKGRSLNLIKGQREEREDMRFVSICIPPKNALLLMRCRSDPLKMAAIANRISSDAGKYNNGGIEEEDDENEIESTSSDEFFDREHKIYVAEIIEKKEMHREEEDCVEEEVSRERLVIKNEENLDEIEKEFDEEEQVERESQEFKSDLEFKQDLDKKSEEIGENDETTTVEEEEEREEVEENKLEAQEPENGETAAKKETAAPPPALPECLLLMMREPKLSMEVSKETWVCATDFIRLLPERPRRHSTKTTDAADHEPVVRKRAAVERSRLRVPAPPGKKNHVQPARSSCSLPAAAMVVERERKRTNGGASEPLALTRCKSEPMSTAAAKLMPDAGCWKDNVEPHSQAGVGFGVGAAGVGF